MKMRILRVANEILYSKGANMHEWMILDCTLSSNTINRYLQFGYLEHYGVNIIVV